MEYLGFSKADPGYDIEGVTIEECSVSLSENVPMVYGPTPFSFTCSVVRNGNRDIAPPAVDRSPADVAALGVALGVAYPGAIVPPVSAALKGGDAEAAQIFVKRCLAHGELGGSAVLLRFLLQEQAKLEVLALPGADMALSVSAGKLTGSVISDDRDVDNTLGWVDQKEKLLAVAKAQALKAQAAIVAAVKETRALLAAGGIVLKDEAFGNDSSAGVARAIEQFEDIHGSIGSLRTAAVHVRTLRERRVAAAQLLAATKKSFEGARLEKSSFSKTAANVKTDEDRAAALGAAVDAAAARFVAEARAFVRDFPARWTAIVNELVDNQVVAAGRVTAALDAAKTDVTVAFGDDVVDIPAAPSVSSSSSSSSPPASAPATATPSKAPGISTGGDAPSWASAMDEEDATSAASAPKQAEPEKKNQPAWTDEANDGQPW